MSGTTTRLDQPGITVRPIVSISGQHLFNQVFLDDVQVPLSDLVHREGEGWTVAKALLQRRCVLGATVVLVRHAVNVFTLILTISTLAIANHC